MTDFPKILFIGHSHIQCIKTALRIEPDPNIRAINLRSSKGLSDEENVALAREAVKGFSPNLVCISLSGNQHNVLGTVESPVPFSVGDYQHGSVPATNGTRQFIPRGMMAEKFSTASSPSLLTALYEAFPGAKRAYLNPPPPIGDWEHIKRHPGAFANKIQCGPAPDALRIALYRIQTDYFRSLADENGAIFIEPDPSTLTHGGFLAKRYFNRDPTHGNAAYGKLMLKKVIDETGALHETPL